MKISPAFLLNYYQTCEEIGGMDSAINPFNVNYYDEINRLRAGDEFEDYDDEGED
jgi:hypothetical protein